jgi:hypothetical protein
MDDRTSTLGSDLKRRSCADPFKLCELQEGQPDKLGHKIEQILWFATTYAIYRTKQGVYVHFSDNEDEASKQRQRFIRICPELCELRYLMPQIRSVAPFFGPRAIAAAARRTDGGPLRRRVRKARPALASVGVTSYSSAVLSSGTSATARAIVSVGGQGERR